MPGNSLQPVLGPFDEDDLDTLSRVVRIRSAYSGSSLTNAAIATFVRTAFASRRVPQKACLATAAPAGLDLRDAVGDDTPDHLAVDDFSAAPPAVQRCATDAEFACELLRVDAPAGLTNQLCARSMASMRTHAVGLDGGMRHTYILSRRIRSMQRGREIWM